MLKNVDSQYLRHDYSEWVSEWVSSLFYPSAG